MKKITAIVPVRKGSVRVKNKNIRPFAGSSLLEIKLNQLKKIEGLDNIVVSSDCEQMLDIATKLNIDTHERENYYASSKVNNSDFFKNLGEHIEGENLMYSPVTCPLISNQTYSECIKQFQEPSVKNLVTVSPIKHHMWLNNKPLNYQIDKSPNSQDLPDIFQITYGISIISKEDMIKYGNIVTHNPTFKILDQYESMDIDTEFDFEVAEFFYKKRIIEGT